MGAPGQFGAVARRLRLRLAHRGAMFPRPTTRSIGSRGRMGAPRRPGGAVPARPRRVQASRDQNGARGRFLDPLLALRHPHPIERRDAAALVRPLVLIWASPPLRWNGRRGSICVAEYVTGCDRCQLAIDRDKVRVRPPSVSPNAKRAGFDPARSAWGDKDVPADQAVRRQAWPGMLLRSSTFDHGSSLDSIRLTLSFARVGISLVPGGSQL